MQNSYGNDLEDTEIDDDFDPDAEWWTSDSDDDDNEYSADSETCPVCEDEDDIFDDEDFEDDFLDEDIDDWEEEYGDV